MRVGNGAIEVGKPRPRQNALGGKMVVAAAQPLDQLELVARMGGERNVTALARHRDPIGAGPDEAGDADAGAWAEHHLGGSRCRRASADPMQLLSAQMRQRQSERLEVVEEKDVVEAARR